MRKLPIRPKGDGDNEISLVLAALRILGPPGTESTICGLSGGALADMEEASWADDEEYLAVRPMLATSDGARYS